MDGWVGPQDIAEGIGDNSLPTLIYIDIKHM